MRKRASARRAKASGSTLARRMRKSGIYQRISRGVARKYVVVDGYRLRPGASNKQKRRARQNVSVINKRAARRISA